MTRIDRVGSTTIVLHPVWTGDGFSEPTAQAFWEQLPDVLRTMARAELAAGNAVTQVLRNDERGIVLLEFGDGPLVGSTTPALRVHTEHRFGNYCYDGTKCTVEDPTTGCFLAFIDPEWQAPL
jgi:hypothetical protein